MIHAYSEIQLNYKKKNKIMSFVATLMEIEILIFSGVSQKEKEKCHMISLVCRI